MNNLKKFVLIFITLVLVSGTTWFLYKNSRSTYESSQNPGENALVSVLTTQDEADSDNDGLKDWEETLWNTDPLNKDSDGDGTPDGQEVKEGRDPHKKGPNDTITTPESQNANQSQDPNKNLTATAALSRDLFARYLDLKQNNKEIDSETQKKLLSEVLSSANATEPFTAYTSTYLNTVQDSPEAIKTYANTLIKISREKSPKRSDNELLVLSQIVQNGDSTGVWTKKLTMTADAYKAIAKSYSTMTVPARFVELHVEYMNILSSIGSDISGMAKFSSDPALAAGSLSRYNQDTATLLKVLTEYKKTLLDAKIVFNRTDPGFAFTTLTR